MNQPIKSFADQFTECEKDGFHTKGEFLDFKTHPELLPAFPSKSMLKAIKESKWKGIQTILCLKFGGRCDSSNKECRKLRGYKNS